MRRVDTLERRSRLAVRHHLASPASDVEQVAGDLVGLHSSDPVAVFLAAWRRVDGFAVADLERALYDEHSLLRMLGMRRTMFVVPVETAAIMDAACTQALVPAERRRLVKLLEEQAVTDDGDDWVTRVSDATLAALDSRGEATAVELTDDVPELALKLRFGEGKKWAGTVGLSTRVLFLLATEGRIVRGRPRGTWVSSQYRWAPTDGWLDGGLPELEPAVARAALVERWLAAFGPGTLTDVKWWTGWNKRDTTAALADIGAVEVDLDGAVGYVLAADVEPAPAPADTWVALLPGLDPTVMGWKERDWFLDGHDAELFDRNGNAGPTVWCDGRIVGAWAQRADGDVVTELLTDVGAGAAALIDAEAERLQAWLADTRVTPRFPTPLERRLRS